MTPDARNVETPREAVDRLRLEVERLRASRERIVRDADAARRRIERELHDGPQQQLVALAVNLELARRLADSDAAAARELLDEIGRDVRHALEETGRLAHRIYPPLLEAGGLAAALRTAADEAGVALRIEAETGARYPPEVAGTLYFCCLDALERAGEGARVTVSVREEGAALAFEIVAEGGGPDDSGTRARDRVEALGGRLETRREPGRGTRISGFLPSPRPGRGSRP